MEDCVKCVGEGDDISAERQLRPTWGSSTNGGVKYYIMDNEHSIWFATQRDVHPAGPTMQEILGKILARLGGFDPL